MTAYRQTAGEIDYVRDTDAAYSNAERVNQRANSHLPQSDLIRRVIRLGGLAAACERWGHLYSSSALVHIAGGQPGGGHAGAWQRRRERQARAA